jgi:xylan 1,4-beta-xylosidase
MGSPAQLTIQQVDLIKEINSGLPIATKMIEIGTSKVLEQEFDIRENDVYFISLVKL